jgi:hypothetical protein
MWKKTKVMRISRLSSTIQIKAQNQPDNVKYFNYVGSMITYNATCTRTITSSIVMAKASFNNQALTPAHWI